MPTPIFQDPRFDALRNAIYHTSRGRFLDALNRFVNFLVIVLGATAVSKAAGIFTLKEVWVELGVVIVATLQLVFDFGGRACAHLYLQKQYYSMLAEMETSDTDSAEAKLKWSAKLITLAADEPLAMRAVDALSYNAALDAWTHDPKQLADNRLHVSWWQRRLRHFVAFQGTQFLPAVRQQNWTSRVRKYFKRFPQEKPDGKKG
jgi:hypothetical protein